MQVTGSSGHLLAASTAPNLKAAGHHLASTDWLWASVKSQVHHLLVGSTADFLCFKVHFNFV